MNGTEKMHTSTSPTGKVPFESKGQSHPLDIIFYVSGSCDNKSTKLVTAVLNSHNKITAEIKFGTSSQTLRDTITIQTSEDWEKMNYQLLLACYMANAVTGTQGDLLFYILNVDDSY